MTSNLKSLLERISRNQLVDADANLHDILREFQLLGFVTSLLRDDAQE